MGKPITKIAITSFRGATRSFDLDIDPDKDLTMLFGENGSGKSSILDAIDVVVNGGVGALEGISVGHNPGQYLCSLGTPPATLSATVQSGAELWTGTMQRHAISTSGPETKPIVKILRRNKILTLVLARPQERYDALRHFIDISVVEQSENALRQKLNAVNSNINGLLAEKERQQNQLENVWESEDRPGPGQTAIEWVKNKAETGIAELNTQLARLTQVVDAIGNTVTAKEDYDSKMSTAATRQSELSTIEQQIESSPGLDAVTAVRLIESLSKAKDYIDVEPDLNKCPTCRRPMARDELISIVDGQLSELIELRALIDQRNTAQRRLDAAATNVSQAEEALVPGMQELHQAVAADDIPEISDLNIAWPDWSADDQDIAHLTSIAEQVEHVKARLTVQRDGIQRDVSQFTSIQQWYEGITGASEAIFNQDRIRTGLRRAHEIVHAKRVSFVQKVLDDISQEANRLFQVIHPGENISLDRLQMEEGRRGSVIQTGVFHAHSDIIPQAVFSESHLDTLGFCVWLALAKREDAANTILLIDDVFSSVDSAHLGRIVDLLAAEGRSYLQIIVATHFRLWWDRCRNAQGIQRVQLGQWTAEAGIVAQNMPLVTRQLRDLAGSPILDRQAVSSKAGVLLEEVLDGLTLLYQCSLPRNKENLYTLGALVGSCRRLFSRHTLTVRRDVNWDTDGQPEDWRPTESKEAFDTIDQFQFIRNQVGCHFNPPGSEIPDDEVRDFGKATVDLVDAITCPNCGYIATKPTTDGASLRCSCRKQAIRMIPVMVQ